MLNPADSPAFSAGPAPQASPAYPRLLRILTVVALIDLLGWGMWSLPTLMQTRWSTGSLVLFGLACGMTAWLGWWIVHSRTRLEGDVLSQTWVWDKRVQAEEVRQLKLVHWRWLEAVVAPRLLVRRRDGTATWFHAADARLLQAFAERAAQSTLQATRSASHADRP